MAEKEKKPKVKKKAPTALKRDLQNEKRRLLNQALKSEMKTALRVAKESGEKSQVNNLYSLMDKGAKKKIYHKNKVARIKSRMHAFLEKNKKA